MVRRMVSHCSVAYKVSRDFDVTDCSTNFFSSLTFRFSFFVELGVYSTLLLPLCWFEGVECFFLLYCLFEYILNISNVYFIMCYSSRGRARVVCLQLRFHCSQAGSRVWAQVEQLV